MTRFAATLGSLALALILGALVASAVALDPSLGSQGVNGTLEAKRAALELPVFSGWVLLLVGAALAGRAAVALHRSDLLLAAFVGFCAASVGWAQNQDEAALRALALAAAALLVPVLRAIAAHPGGARRVLALLVLGAVLSGALDVVLRMVAGGPLMVEGSEKFSSKVFPHDNVAALLFAPLLLVCAVFATLERGRVRRLALAGALALLAVLVLLRSKAGLIALVAGPVLLWILIKGYAGFERLRARSRSLAALAATGGLGALVGLVLLPAHPAVSALLKERFNQFVTLAHINYYAAYMRPGIWKSTFAMTADHPLGGVGIGNFTFALPPYDLENALRPHAHNQFIQVLAETGVVGLVLFSAYVLVVLGAVLSRASKPRVGDGASAVVTARAVAGGLLVFLLQAVFETPLLFPFTAALFFAFAALATAPADPAPASEAGGTDVRRWPLLRFALLPALAACIVFTWLPEAVAPLRQCERVRAARLAIAAGRSEDAERLLRSALAIGTDNYAIHDGLARMLSASGRFDEALAEWGRALALFPENWELHKFAGICSARLGRTAEALAHYDEVRRLIRHDGETGFLRGEALYRAGRCDEAIEVLEAYRETVPENAPTLLVLGGAYYDRARKNAALEDAGKALEIYRRYVAIGGAQQGNWVSERVAQLGYWMQEKQVDAPPKEGVKGGTEGTSSDGG